MTQLKIYDSQGYRFTGDGRQEDRLDAVDKLFKNGIKLAVRSGSQDDIFLYFKAKETGTARFEQFCARYRPRPSDPKPLRTLIENLRSKVEDEWGYIIKKDDSVYSELADHPVVSSSPGSGEDRSVFRRLVTQNRKPVVGVRDVTRALSLIGEVESDVSSYAIAEKEPSGGSWDAVVVIGNNYSGIQPLGDTKQAWETEERKYKTSSLKNSVNWLERTQGFSDSEIKRKAGLRTPSDRSGSGSDSGFDVVNLALIGIIAVGLLVVVAVGSMMFLGVSVSDVPFVDGDHEIEGNVTSTDGAALENADARLLEEGDDGENDIQHDNTTTDESGTYVLSAPPGEYQLEVDHPDYESETRNVVIPPEDDEEGTFEFELEPAQAEEEDVEESTTEEDSGDTEGT